jgi:hypothetical protein
MRLGLAVYVFVVAAFLIAGHYHREWFVKAEPEEVAKVTASDPGDTR